MMWNAGSPASKRRELIFVLNKNKTHIALITETWLSSGVDFSIPGHKSVRADRKQGNGGDVAILIHNSIRYTVVPFNFPDGYEAVFIRIHNPSLFVGVAYNPPRNSLTSADLYAITSLGSPLLVGGDFNARHRSWRNSTVNRNGITLYNHSLGDTYRILAPDDFTFHAPGTNPSVLDIFLINSNKSFDCEVTDDFHTNHRPVVLRAGSDLMHPPGWVRSTDWDLYGRLTGRYQLRTSFDNLIDIDQCIHSLNAYLKLYLRSASTFTPSRAGGDYSLDTRLLAYIRDRRGIRKAWQRTGHSYFWDLMKFYTCEINSRLRKLRRED